LPSDRWRSFSTEHLEHGFPEPAEIEAALRPHGRVRLLGNESLAAP